MFTVVPAIAALIDHVSEKLYETVPRLYLLRRVRLDSDWNVYVPPTARMSLVCYPAFLLLEAALKVWLPQLT